LETLEGNGRRIAICEHEIDSLSKQLERLTLATGKNAKVQQYIAYAKELFDYFNASYVQQERDVKTRLLDSVNNIFSQMYHGKRKVEIDDKYRIHLATTIGEERIVTDLSAGAEAIKNFSFVGGLVDLARKKARESTPEGKVAAEPYPLIMDAPFSVVDELHVANIAKTLPQVAEQIILILMQKDWEIAVPALKDKIGKSYTIEKFSETHSEIREVENV
jgi:DNA sulfur modification protein DndD